MTTFDLIKVSYPSESSEPFHNNLHTTIPTVIKAVNKFKDSQFKEIQAKNRLKITERIQQRKERFIKNQQTKLEYFEEVKRSISIQREIKNEAMQNLKIDLQMRKTFNSHLKDQHKKVIERVKKSFLDANHKISQQIRKKKKLNDEIIHNFKYENLKAKNQRKKKQEDKEKQRRKSLNNFHQQKLQSIKRQKQQIALLFLEKSAEREKNLTFYNSNISRIHQNILKTTSNSLLSIKNPQINNLKKTDLE